MRKVKGVTDQAPDPDDSVPQTRKRTGAAILWAFGSAIVIPLLVLVVTILVLIDRDIEAPDWVRAKIADQLAAATDDISVEVDAIHLRLGRDLHPRVRLDRVRFRGADNQPIGQLREVTALVSPRGIVFDQTVLLQDVAVHGARLVVRRSIDGAVSLAFGNQAGLGDVPSLAAVLDQVDQVFQRPVLAAMENVTLTGVIVEYIDARAGRSWTVDGGRMTLALQGGATRIGASLSVLSGGADVTRITLDYNRGRTADGATVALEITDAQAADLATQTPAFSWLAAIRAPISATLRTRLDTSGGLEPISAALTVGAGTVEPVPEAPLIAFDAAKAYLTYDPLGGAIAFDTLEVVRDAMTVRASGQAHLVQPATGAAPKLVAQLQIDPVRIASSAAFPDGVTVPKLGVDMRMGFAPFTIEIGQAVAQIADARVAARGHFRSLASGWDVAVDLNVDTIDTQAALAFWPRNWRQGARDRVVSQLRAGTLDQVAVHLRQAPQSAPILRAQSQFRDGQLRASRKMPQVRRAAGVMSLDAGAITIVMDRAVMRTRAQGVLDLAGSTVVLPLDPAKGAPQLRLVATGPARAAGAVYAGYAASMTDRVRQILTGIEGRIALDMDVTLPPAGQSPDFDLNGTLFGVASDHLIRGRRLTGDRLRLRAVPSEVRVSGPMQHAGQTFDVVYVAPAGQPATVDVTGPLSAQTLTNWGVPVPQGAVSGQAEGRLVATLIPDKPATYRVTSDTVGLAVSVPAARWSKPRSARGQLRVEGSFGPTPTVDRIRFETADLVLDGRLILERGGAVQRAEFADLRIGRWFNGPLTLTPQGTGKPMAITTTGGSVDLRRMPAARAAQRGRGAARAPLSLRLDRVRVTDKISITDVTADLVAGQGVSGQFTGRLNDGPLITGTLTPQDASTALRIRSADAGAVIRAAGMMKTTFGGTLDAVLRPTGQVGQFDGAVTIKSIRLRDAPAIAAILDAISVVGLLQQLDGQGLSFDTVEAAFRLTPSQVIVTSSSAVGPGLGVSLDGVFGLTDKALNFQGVVSPFYLLNGIGSFLTRKGEGLIGFNFNLTGDAAAPVVDVNPLSALTPGMFREIFRRPPPQVSQ